METHSLSLLSGTRSIRSFLGASNFEVSRSFYRTIGFNETILWEGFSLFSTSSGLSFYLQDAYVKDWVDNTQMFLEVEDVNVLYDAFLALDLPTQFAGARLIPVRQAHWGNEFFLHDPSGILWHFGTFHDK